MRVKMLSLVTLFVAASSLTAASLVAQTRPPRRPPAPPQPDADPEYLDATPAYAQFVLLPRGGWPEATTNDPSYETLRFGAPRIISFEAGEGYIEGDIIVAPREELIAREGLTKALGAVIIPGSGETGAEAMLRSAGLARVDRSDLKSFRSQVLEQVEDTIRHRAGGNAALEQQARAEAARIFDALAATRGSRILSTTISLGKRWPDPMTKPIQYTTKNLPGYATDWIAPAIAEWEKVGIKFQKVDTVSGDGITFVGGSGCSSHVGMKGGVQPIRLASGCKNAVVHEIGHALGLFHEQSHPDRDQFVTIVWSNIRAGHEHNFAIKQNPGRTTVYDYGSIMHYSATAFARDKSKPTLIPKDPAKKIGQRRALSPLDIQGIKLLYAAAPE